MDQSDINYRLLPIDNQIESIRQQIKTIHQTNQQLQVQIDNKQIDQSSLSRFRLIYHQILQQSKSIRNQLNTINIQSRKYHGTTIRKLLNALKLEQKSTELLFNKYQQYLEKKKKQQIIEEVFVADYKVDKNQQQDQIRQIVVQQQVYDNLKQQELMLLERQQEIDKIGYMIGQIKEIMHEANQMVDDQQGMIQIVEDNYEQSNQNVVKAYQEVEKVLVKARRRRKTVVCYFCFGVVLLFIVVSLFYIRFIM